MEYGHNTVAVCYEIENGSEEAKLNLVPLFNYREAGETSERSELKFDVKVCEKTLTLIPNNNKDIKIEFYTSEGSYYDRSLIKTSTKNEYIINHFNFISYDLRNAQTPVCKQRTRTCNQSGYYRLPLWQALTNIRKQFELFGSEYRI